MHRHFLVYMPEVEPVIILVAALKSACLRLLLNWLSTMPVEPQALAPVNLQCPKSRFDTAYRPTHATRHPRRLSSRRCGIYHNFVAIIISTTVRQRYSKEVVLRTDAAAAMLLLCLYNYTGSRNFQKKNFLNI